ncbi:MAG: hypothetical protein PHT12_03330 [Patescibacteria group bacterium]|nr:hypothetical protein [Patescibacteria group bacterium]
MAAPTPKKRKAPFNIAPWLPIITVVAGLGYAAAAYFLLLMPKISPLMAGGGYDYAPLRQRVTEDRQYLDKVRSSLVDYEKLTEADKDRIGQAVPTDTDFPGLMVQLDALVRRHSMLLLSLDAVVDEKSVNAVGRKPVRLSVTLSGGDYETLKATLTELERSLRIVDVSSVSFSPDSGFGIALRTYYVDLTKTAAKPAAAPAVPANP